MTPAIKNLDVPKLEELIGNGCKHLHLLRTKYLEFYKFLQSKYPNLTNTSEQLYWYYHNLTEHPKCPVCGGSVKFFSLTRGYQTHCSARCAQNNKKVRNKLKQTCLERYGVENAAKSSSIRKSISESNKKTQSQQEVKSKIKQTKLKLYGDENYNNKEKRKQTCMERYGGPAPTCSTSVIETRRLNTLNRYGVEHGSQIDIYKKHPELIRIISDNTWICRCFHPQCSLCQERQYETYSQLHNDRLRAGTEPCTILHPLQDCKSGQELQIREFIKEQGIECSNKEDKKILCGKGLDIYIPSYQLAIEVNGCYYHSLEKKPEGYHTWKYLECKKRNIKLITIWEDWWKEHRELCEDLILYHLGLKKVEHWKFAELGPLNLVDLNLYPADNIEPHHSIHNGHVCEDAGIFIA